MSVPNDTVDCFEQRPLLTAVLMMMMVVVVVVYCYCIVLLIEKKMSAHTSRDVYAFASNGDSTSLTAALATSSNRSSWYTDENQYDWNALHVATFNGYLNCIIILLDSGIDINSKDNYNRTSLSWAASCGHLQCMELLLARGADINIRNKDNRTALHYTAIDGHEACVSLLLNNGAAIDDHDIDSYKTYLATHTDCRPLIVAEVEHRRMRTFNHYSASCD